MAMKQTAVDGRPMQRQGSDTSSSNRAYEERSAKSKATEGEVNLRHYVTKLGLPAGLHSAIESAYHDMESRIWIVDNSLDMNAKDCNLILADDKLEKIGKEKGASRWSEQLQCVDFHLKMAARSWIPTKFWMVNVPRDHPQRYGICWGNPAKWALERDHASQIMLKELKPEKDHNPLGPEVLKVAKKLQPEAVRMEEEGKFVSVVICTQGRPKNERGESSPQVMKDCIINLKALAKFPVKITFRLCTGDDDVLNFYRKAGRELGLDVLGDYWDEAKIVNQNNPWLTYGIGLHRMREAGLGIDALELINSPMSLSQMYEFCNELFAPEKDSMRHPKKDWDGFITDLKLYLLREKLVWNPIKKQLSPWIDLEQLQSFYDKSRSRQAKSSGRVSPDAANDPKKSTSFHGKNQSSHRRMATVSDAERLDFAPKKSTSFNGKNQSSHRRRVTVSDAELPSNIRKTTSFHQKTGQHMRRHTEADADKNESPAGFRSFRRSAFAMDPPEASTSSRKIPPNRMPQKAKSYHERANQFDPLPFSKNESSTSKDDFVASRRSSIKIKDDLFQELFGLIDDDEDDEPEVGKLGKLIKDWSHDSYGKLRPLHELLFEAPVLLPPKNPLVKHHEYFDKWKVLHRDAFQDEGGNSDGVVHKVARRCKIFLHPDKWPSDLCDDQKFLLQSMWDAFQESELF